MNEDQPMDDAEFMAMLDDLTPFKLLSLRRAYNDWRFHDSVTRDQWIAFEQRMGMINAELTKRRRCIYCGLLHNHTECQLVTHEDAPGLSLEGDNLDDEGITA